MNFKSIRVRVTAAILMCAVVGVVLFEAFWLPRLNSMLTETQTTELQKGITILSEGLLPYLVSNQIGAVYETLQNVEAQYPEWVQVSLTRPDGGQLYPLEPLSELQGDNLSTESMAISLRGEDLAVLSVVADFGPQLQYFQNEQIRIFFIGMIIVALILFANIYLVDRLITRRILMVTEAADELADGNYDAVLPSGADEVGLLANSFCLMRDRIRDQTAKLDAARVRAELALEARSRFLATMSHEIRTPLNGIIPVAELLRHSKLEPSQFEKVDIIVKSGKALSAIVNDILDVSMLAGGKLTIQKVEFSPNELVTEALEVVRSTAEHKGLKIVNAFNAPADIRLHGDNSRIRQVLINLLGNAIKFTESGTITLKGFAKPKPNGHIPLHFEVIDTGIGIPDDAVSRIFERFEQVDGSIERRFGGTGLGLSIVKDLMDAMEGRVSVTSCIGQGSTFTLDLELEAITSPPVPKAESGIEPLSYSDHRTALIVDDNGINRTVGSAILTKLGYKAELAENGVVGVSKAQDKKFDVILMDMHMPEMDGLIATQKIRETDGPNAQTKIIALTASVQAEDIEKCRTAGMDDFLSKPINIKNLTTMLSDCS